MWNLGLLISARLVLYLIVSLVSAWLGDWEVEDGKAQIEESSPIPSLPQRGPWLPFDRWPVNPDPLSWKMVLSGRMDQTASGKEVRAGTAQNSTRPGTVQANLSRIFPLYFSTSVQLHLAIFPRTNLQLHPSICYLLCFQPVRIVPLH